MTTDVRHGNIYFALNVKRLDARVVELVDSLASGASARKGVRVRLPPRAPTERDTPLACLSFLSPGGPAAHLNTQRIANMEKQTITIGLPRALLYYRYYALWRTFFQELGIEVAVSTPTDRDILDRAEKEGGGGGLRRPGHRRGLPVAENLPGPRGRADREVRLYPGPPGEQFRAAPKYVHPV